MKINGLSFGISAVANRVRRAKGSTVESDPKLILSVTKGNFSITGSLSKALGLKSGDNIMFANNIADVESIVTTKENEDLLNYAKENGFDLNTAEGVNACIKSLTVWYIAKGVPLFKNDGTELTVSVRTSKEEKKKLYDENIDSIIAANRDQLIAAYNLNADATDDEIKEHYTVDEMQSPRTQAFSGCKLASNSNVVGTGFRLNFSDSNNWEQLKADMEDKTAFRRVFSVDIKNGETGKFNDGHKIVDVTYYPLGEYTDEKPARVAANKAADDAE